MLTFEHYRNRAAQAIIDKHRVEIDAIAMVQFNDDMVKRVAVAHARASGGTRPIEGIKILREVFDIGLKEAKDLYEQAQIETGTSLQQRSMGAP